MSLFYSYVARDVVEVEPVYFPGQVGENGGIWGDEDVSMEEHTDRQRYQLTFNDILMHRLTERYVGKIVPGFGFCIAIHDVLQYTQGIVRGASASAWLTVQFRVCLFAPTPGARLRAVISAQNCDGIFLSLDFFQFVFFVPGDQLVSPSTFHEEKKCWVLHVEDGEEEEDPAEPVLNPYENGDEVIVRVERVIVRDPVEFHSNVGTKGTTTAAAAVVAAPGGGAGDGVPAAESPMEVLGSFVGTGLGPVLWFEA